MMDYRDEIEVERLIKEKTRFLKKRGSFYDDYENDSIEIWDAIEELQKQVKVIQAEIRVLTALRKVAP